MKKKLTAVALIVCMIAIMLVGATMAYFTDKTEVKENVFTVGNVDITLTEDAWDASGKEDAPEVYPGEALAKDPVVTNVGKNPCFVRISVTGLNCLGENDLITYETAYETGKLGEGWVLHTDGYFYYTKPLCVEGTEGESWNEGLAAETTKLFEQIRIPTTLTNNAVEGDETTEGGFEWDNADLSVDVQAQAVQAQGAQPSWSAVKGMTVEQIATWFATCGMN